eukprot:3011549-Prymnesium_polylepis.1
MAVVRKVCAGNVCTAGPALPELCPPVSTALSLSSAPRVWSWYGLGRDRLTRLAHGARQLHAAAIEPTLAGGSGIAIVQRQRILVATTEVIKCQQDVHEAPYSFLRRGARLPHVPRPKVVATLVPHCATTHSAEARLEHGHTQ